MKKTLIITMEFPPHIGGIATYIHQFAGSLDPKDVIVMAPEMPGSKEFDAAQPYNIVRVPFLYPKWIWPRWLRLHHHVKTFIKTYQVEVIHVHHVLPVAYVAKMMKKTFGIPYLIFSHGTDVASASATKWKTRMMNMVTKDAEQIIVNSNNLKDRLLAAFPALEPKTSVLYPCPNAEFLTPPPQEDVEALIKQYALEGKRVLLSVSRLDNGKGFPHLIRLMPRILEQVPYLVWFIVGDGPQKDQILADIRKHNLQNIVRFIGEIPHEQLKKYYHLADIFVLLTHPYQGKEEGLGLVFLEAATAGLPIVAGKSGGVEEAVLHGETGLVIDVKQHPDDIIQAIVRLVKDDDMAEKLGDAGRDRIQQKFVWKEQLKSIAKWL